MNISNGTNEMPALKLIRPGPGQQNKIQDVRQSKDSSYDVLNRVSGVKEQNSADAHMVKRMLLAAEEQLIGKK